MVDPGIISAREGVYFSVQALPIILGDDGELVEVGKYTEGAAVFDSDEAAFKYLLLLAKRDLQHRGARTDRVRFIKEGAQLLGSTRV